MGVIATVFVSGFGVFLLGVFLLGAVK